MNQKSAIAEVSRSGGLAVAAHFGTKLASRAIPGVGEVLLAYDGVSMGYELVTGKPFSDTAVGGAIDTVATKGENLALSGASGLLSAVGCKDAAKFVDTTGRWALTGSDGSDIKPEAAGATNPTWRTGPFRTAAADDLSPATGSLDKVIDPELLRTTAFAPEGRNGVPLREAALASTPATSLVDPLAAARDHQKQGEIATASNPVAKRAMIADQSEKLSAAAIASPPSAKTDRGVSR